jgi:hypothetical protein
MLRFIIGTILFIVLIVSDILFGDWIMSKVPNNEWYEFIEVVIWLLIVYFNIRIVNHLVRFMVPPKKNIPNAGKSKWQERIEQALKEREENRDKHNTNKSPPKDKSI